MMQQAMTGLLQTQKLNVKDQSGVRRNNWRITSWAVGIIWRTCQLGTLPNAHLKKKIER